MMGHRDSSDALEADQPSPTLERRRLELLTLGYLIANGENFDDLIAEWAHRLTAELAGARTNN